MARGAGAVRSRRLIVLGVLGVLCTVTLAPHVRLYVEQEQRQAQVRADIVAREAAVADLQRQAKLWNDDAFVATQARERLRYVFPGETSYVVAPELLAAGSPTPAPGDADSSAGDPAADDGRGGRGGAVQPWYRELWDGFGAAAAAAEPAAATR